MWVDDLLSLLVTAGVGVLRSDDTAVRGTIGASTQWTVPSGDGPYTVVIETGGTSPDETHNSVAQPAYQRPGAQIVVFAKTYSAARATAKTAYLALRVRNRTINGVWYRSIDPRQEPFDMGSDPMNRAKVGFNVLGNKSFS